MSNHKKPITISFLLLVFVFLVISWFIVRTYFISWSFNNSSQYAHPEVLEWMAESDISGEGVFVLRLSQERADQFFFASARPEDQELPDDVFSAFIYINSFGNDDIERVYGRVEVEHSFIMPFISIWFRPRATLRVFYRTKGTYEYLEDSYLYPDYDLPEEYINFDYFSGYELSDLSAVDAGITNLEIFINGEKVDFHLSMLD